MTDETLITAAAATDTVAATDTSAAATETGAANTDAAATEAAKPAEGAATDQGAQEAKTEDAPKLKAPESYTDFTLPEGVQIAPEVADNLKALAKDLDLTQDQAQKVADLGAQMSQRWAQQQTDALAKARTDWAEAAKVDTEYGGEKFNENMAAAKKALDAFGSPELTKLLNESGIGNHPEVIRVFVRAGKAIGDGKFVAGTKAAVSDEDKARRLYPTMSQ